MIVDGQDGIRNRSVVKWEVFKSAFCELPVDELSVDELSVDELSGF